MVKSKVFKYIVDATNEDSGMTFHVSFDDINAAMEQVASMGKHDYVVHSVRAVVTTVEETVLLDLDEWRGGDDSE